MKILIGSLQKVGKEEKSEGTCGKKKISGKQGSIQNRRGVRHGKAI
jgi:hypothetical protein